MPLVRLPRRPIRTLAIVAATLVIAVFVLPTKRHHALQSELFKPYLSQPRQIQASDVAALCRKHGFSPYRQRNRKVYDLFLFDHELDWLEIRLNELYPYVDYFVIVEGKNSFTNIPKPAILQENYDNFTIFHPKMLNYVVDDTVESERAWDHEDFFRNALLYSTFPPLRGGEKQATDGDVLIVSDIDEIPKPETVILLRYCGFPERLSLRSHFYYYSFQWLHRGEQWPHPEATVFHGIKNTISPVDLRNGEGGPRWRFLPFIRPLQRWWHKADLLSATWHCSSCFPTIEEFRMKMERFSHRPWNTYENRKPETIAERVRHGLDLFGREGEFYDRIENNRDVPAYVRANEDKFRYLLNRDGEDAGFRDYDPQNS